MKLLFCLNCEDIIRLNMKTRSCGCGAVSGHYLDNKMAVYTGDNAVPLGISNYSLMKAVSWWRTSDADNIDIGGDALDAFTISKDCSTFVKKETI